MTIVFLILNPFWFFCETVRKKVINSCNFKNLKYVKIRKKSEKCLQTHTYHIQVILAAEPHFWYLCIRVFSLFLCKSNLQLIWSTLCKWHRYNHFLSLTVNTIKAGFIPGFFKTGLIIMFINGINFNSSNFSWFSISIYIYILCLTICLFFLYSINVKTLNRSGTSHDPMGRFMDDQNFKN